MSVREKPCIGVVCRPKPNSTEMRLFPILEREFNVVYFPVYKNVDYDQLHEEAQYLRVVINTAGDEPDAEDATEMVKTFESMGKHVINSSRSLYYHEDKWLFYLTCLKHNLPTPKTYYIPRDIGLSRNRLKDILAGGPVVVKAIFFDTGRAVRRAMNYEEAVSTIKKIRKIIGAMPMIAQRYIPHGTVSYRVMLFGETIIQAVKKSGKTWKEGGLSKNERYTLFTPDEKLAALCKKTAKIFGIEWCGIDLMRDASGAWYLIEVNSCPSLDFVTSDMSRINNELVRYLLRADALIQQRRATQRL